MFAIGIYFCSSREVFVGHCGLFVTLFDFAVKTKKSVTVYVTLITYAFIAFNDNIAYILSCVLIHSYSLTMGSGQCQHAKF